MSVEVYVYLRNSRLPTHAEWQAAINKENVNLVLDEFSPREHTGFLPCRLNGSECGFEYLFHPLEDQDAEIRGQIGECARLVEMIWHGRMDDARAAMYAAAVLTEISGGVFHDLQTGEFATGRGVYELMRQAEESARERGRRAAAKDAAVTDQ